MDNTPYFSEMKQTSSYVQHVPIPDRLPPSNSEFENKKFATFLPRAKPIGNSTQHLSNYNENETRKFSSTVFNTAFNQEIERIDRTNMSLYNACGVPGVCNPSAQSLCLNTTVSECRQCGSVASGFFIILILCLGLAILFGNLLILLVTVHRYQKKTAAISDWYKASLAVADTLTGLLIFFVVLPNFVWTLNSTLIEISLARSDTHNSAQAIAVGFFYLLSFTSSLYHLLLLGVMRLYAIKCPIRYRLQTSRTIYVTIAITWSLAVIVASFPAWFPTHFSFDYYHVTFLYLPSLTITSSSSSFTPGIITFLFLLVFPYVMMTLILIATAILVRIEIKSFQKILSQQTPNDVKKLSFSKQEIAAFKTVTAMQMGFTVTLVPLCVALFLIYSLYFTCESFSTSYLVCIYIGMTNSLVNVLVYSLRDKKFCSTVRNIFQRFKLRMILEGIGNSKSTTSSKV